MQAHWHACVAAGSPPTRKAAVVASHLRHLLSLAAAVLYVPSAHNRHSVAPLPSALIVYLPPPHGVQPSALGPEISPGGQVLHRWEPRPLAKSPAALHAQTQASTQGGEGQLQQQCTLGVSQARRHCGSASRHGWGTRHTGNTQLRSTETLTHTRPAGLPMRCPPARQPACLPASRTHHAGQPPVEASGVVPSVSAAVPDAHRVHSPAPARE